MKVHHTRVKTFISITCILAWFANHCVQCEAASSARFAREAGKRYTDVAARVMTVSSAAACAATCLEDDATCTLVSHNAETRQCETASTSTPELVQDAAGWNIYRKIANYGEACSATRVCVEALNTCYAGLDICACDPYTSNYNEATQTCTLGCASYSGEFERYPQVGLYGFDAEIHYNQMSVTACFQHCAQVTAYTCHNIDYEFVDNICYFNNIHVADVPNSPEIGYMVAVSTFDFYVRHCLN